MFVSVKFVLLCEWGSLNQEESLMNTNTYENDEIRLPESEQEALKLAEKVLHKVPDWYLKNKEKINGIRAEAAEMMEEHNMILKRLCSGS